MRPPRGFHPSGGRIRHDATRDMTPATRVEGDTVPTGKVKWYDAEKGFGFLSQDDGEDVYVLSLIHI